MCKKKNWFNNLKKIINNYNENKNKENKNNKMSSILEELAQYSAKIANSFNELSKNIVVLNIFFWKIYDSKIDFFDELNINYQVICKKIIEINIAKSKFSKICNENKIGKYISNEKLLEYVNQFGK